MFQQVLQFILTGLLCAAVLLIAVTCGVAIALGYDRLSEHIRRNRKKRR